MAHNRVTEEEFKEAVEKNNYAELDLGDGFVLVKDVDSTPYVVADKQENPQDSMVLANVEEKVGKQYKPCEAEYDESNSNEAMDIYHLYFDLR